MTVVCDVYRLIDEFIVKSPNDLDTSGHTQTATSPSPPLSSMATTTSSSSLSTNECNVKPNRPYSYYAATNFNPLDQQQPNQLIDNKQTNSQQQSTPEPNDTTRGIKKFFKRHDSSEKILDKKKSKKANTNRLSVSMVDVKQLTNTPTNTTPIDKMTSQSCVLNNNSVCITPNSTKKRRNRFNLFLRRLFHYKTNNNNNQMTDDTSSTNDTSESSKFSRLFSFRTNKTPKNQSNQTPIATMDTKHILQTNLDSPLKVNTERESIESSYSDIVAKLKRIVNESRPICDSNNNTIPYIDDDELANRNSYVINTDCLSARQLAFNDYLINLNLQSTMNNPKSKFGIHSKNALPDILIKSLVDNPTNAVFESLILTATSDCDTKWQKIAKIFEIAYRAVRQTDGSDTETSASIIKHMAAEYIHVKYCEWIEKEGGGWKSVPDSLSPSDKSTDLDNID